MPLQKEQRFTSKHDQTETPLCVSERTSSEQHFVVVQTVGLSVYRQRPFEFVQAVVGGLATHFTYETHVLDEKQQRRKMFDAM